MRSILLLCLLAVPAAFAQSPAPDFSTQVWLNPGIYSHHFKRDQNFREDNVGFGAEVAFAPEHRIMAGTFINSDRGRTRYAAYNWQPLQWKPGGVNVSAGVIAGAFDGYPFYKDGGWFLAAMPVLAIEGRYVGVNLSIVPEIPDRLSGAVAIQFKLRVW